MGVAAVACMKVSIDGTAFIITCSSTGNDRAGAFGGAIGNVQRFVRAVSPGRGRYMLRTANGCDVLLICLLSGTNFIIDVRGPLGVGGFTHIVLSIIGASRVSTHLVTLCNREVRPTPFGLHGSSVLLLGRGHAMLHRLGGRLATGAGLRNSLGILPFVSSGDGGILRGAVGFLRGRVGRVRRRLASLTRVRCGGRVSLLASVGKVKTALTTTLVVTANKFACFSGTGRLAQCLKLSPACRRSNASIGIGNRVGHGKSTRLQDRLCVKTVTSLQYGARYGTYFSQLQSGNGPKGITVVTITGGLVERTFTIMARRGPCISKCGSMGPWAVSPTRKAP